MLRPTKHSHPDKTVINMALQLLVRLRLKRVEKFDSLLKFSKKAIKGGDVLFLPALNFLYLFDLIEYRQKTDSFEYLNKNETV